MSVMSYRNKMVYVAFLNCWFKCRFVVGFVSNICHKNVGKENCCLCVHCSFMGFQVVLSIEVREIFFEDEFKHFQQVMCRNRLSLQKFSYALQIILIPSFCGIFVSTLITSIETRTVRFFTFVFSMKGMISVILILVVAMYQEILSHTEQGFIGLLRGNQKSMF